VLTFSDRPLWTACCFIERSWSIFSATHHSVEVCPKCLLVVQNAHSPLSPGAGRDPYETPLRSNLMKVVNLSAALRRDFRAASPSSISEWRKSATNVDAEAISRSADSERLPRRRRNVPRRQGTLVRNSRSTCHPAWNGMQRVGALNLHLLPPESPRTMVRGGSSTDYLRAPRHPAELFCTVLSYTGSLASKLAV
jgi:hypothetical protein